MRIKIPSSPPGTIYGIKTENNSFGLRDKDYLIPKPKDTYRILVLGDSFGWGFGVELNKTYMKLLERKLNNLSEAKKIEVINGAVPGTNTIDQVKQLERIGLKYEPDMILLVYNLNDVEYYPTGNESEVIDFDIDNKKDYERFGLGKGIRGQIQKLETRSRFILYLVGKIGSTLRGAGLIKSEEFSWIYKNCNSFVDDNPGWIHSKSAIREIRDISKRKRMEFVLVIHPFIVNLNNYPCKDAHRTIREFGEREKIPTLDLFPFFEGKNTGKLIINPIDSHPNEKGNEITSEALFPFVSRLIFK